MKRGKFIVIDGGEGSGKTTMLKMLVEKFPAGKIVTTHEPGGTEFAEKIRGLILSPDGKEASAETHFALNWAYRHDHLEKMIKPNLEKGITVISDRFDSSTYAYQVVAQDAPHLEKLFWQTREVYLRKTKPDLYIFFDVDPEVGLDRVALRKEEKTHFDVRKLDFHNRVRAGFKKFLKKVPHEIIDANQPVDKVFEEFFKIVQSLTGI